MVTTIPIGKTKPDEFQPHSVLLQDVSWETYQALVRDLESQPGKRLTYDRGLLEIVMPLPPHEKYKKYLARIVEIVTEELEIEICSLGSATWGRSDLAKGLEADECYYIQQEAAVRGKMSIDLSIDPPPDLAIEIDITSTSISRLAIYKELGVPEIWRFDGSKVFLLSLVAGDYVEIEKSLVLPIVTAALLQSWLEQTQTMGETSWARSLRSGLRS